MPPRRPWKGWCALKFAIASAFGLALVLTGCALQESESGAEAPTWNECGVEGMEGGRFGRAPFRSAWCQELDLPLEVDVLQQLVIGGDPVEGNFVNRGDIEVDFTGSPGRIVVETRRFTSAEDAEHAASNFSYLALYTNPGDVVPPHQSETEPCTEVWRDGCKLRAYYDGLQQPTRDGMDIRVTLPPGSVEELIVTTTDSAVDEAYPNRGDVTIRGLEGSAQVLTGSGRTRVDLGPQAAGTLSALTRGAGDMELILPSGLWLEAELRNGQEGENPCEPVVDCGGGGTCTATQAEPGSPWDYDVVAHEGQGTEPYRATFGSTQCIEVARVEDPEDYDMPQVGLEGTITLRTN